MTRPADTDEKTWQFYLSLIRQMTPGATLVPLTLKGNTVSCPVTSAEDILLAKISWLQQGGSSERQRHDIEGIINANQTLDRTYLESWARRLGVAQLLKTFLQ